MTITPQDLVSSYGELQSRIVSRFGNGCDDLSLRLSCDFADELAFYKLTIWAYVVVTEAAAVPVKFLMALPPARSRESVQGEFARIRAHIVHNSKPWDRRGKRDIVYCQAWFEDACGEVAPRSNRHFSKCCEKLAKRMHDVLTRSIEASKLLDHRTDGDRLRADLRDRLRHRANRR